MAQPSEVLGPRLDAADKAVLCADVTVAGNEIPRPSDVADLVEKAGLAGETYFRTLCDARSSNDNL